MGHTSLVCGLYLVCVAGFTYGLAEQQVGYGSDVAGALILASLGVLHVATGLGAGRWWAVLLPVLAVIVAVPAGYPDEARGEPLPIWLGLAFFAPIGALLIAAGVAMMQARSRRHRPGREAAD